MYISNTLLSLFLATTVSLADARVHPKRCDDHPAPTAPAVPGSHEIDFSHYLPESGTAEAFLNKRGYMVSSYDIKNDGVQGSKPRVFEKSNVDIVDGALRLKVRGEPSNGMISSAEIESTESFTYGTLETIAKGTPVEGVCQGIFFYESDHAEIDIELLSSYYTKGYRQYLNPGVQYTNQALADGEDSTTMGQRYGFDPTADFHNYTIQWTDKDSKFFIDGELRNTFKTNVPVGIPSKIIYNNWANGDPKWSAGPPDQDAYFLIKSFKYTPLH